MFTICKNFIKVNNDLFRVIRVFREESILNTDMVKEWLMADAIYKRDQMLYFCEKIEELEILN